MVPAVSRERDGRYFRRTRCAGAERGASSAEPPYTTRTRRLAARRGAVKLTLDA
jgi:hypothetical protein